MPGSMSLAPVPPAPKDPRLGVVPGGYLGGRLDFWVVQPPPGPSPEPPGGTPGEQRVHICAFVCVCVHSRLSGDAHEVVHGVRVRVR